MAKRKAAKKKKSVRKTQAQRADRHELYERSVQDPTSEVDFVARTFKRLRKRPALRLREDFSGTSVLSLQWAKSHPERKAWGVDLCAETLAWGQTHRVDAAGEDVAKRVKLLEGNVLDGLGPKVDVTTAYNFSYWILEDRATMLRYFKLVRSKLVPDGVFFLDVLGGTDLYGEDENRVDHGDFTYVWKQLSFDPLTHHMKCQIGFEFPDGSSIARAFTYEWRLWSPPELRDLLLEAGFSRVRLMWEKTGEDDEGTGSFYEPKRAENTPLWWTYIVAER
ncbi:MAG: class I SAM-dependent methyltransferase [Myxococcales bacterium FL481]|nr:MAG: class I SAM-dependent methyltransferase [Myxococcales bacterium FL481]